MTSEFDLTMNLDANAQDGAKFSKPIQIYDSVGKQHLATLSLQKHISTGATPTTSWSFDITIPNNEIAGVAADDTAQYSLVTGGVATGDPSAGTLQFDTAGKLVSASIGTSGPSPLADLTFPATGSSLAALADGGTLAGQFTWKVLDDDGSPLISGFASPNDVSAMHQNGSPSGSLSNLIIGSDGVVSAIFDNGTASTVAQIVLAQFTNMDGLMTQGGGMYSETVASGAGLIGVPGEGGRVSFMNSTLEQSNVDMASELTKIITFQRGYQASARMITVTDQILQETMNMKQ
jgi:flagellar hook protein FlgE